MKKRTILVYIQASYRSSVCSYQGVRLLQAPTHVSCLDPFAPVRINRHNQSGNAVCNHSIFVAAFLACCQEPALSLLALPRFRQKLTPPSITITHAGPLFKMPREAWRFECLHEALLHRMRLLIFLNLNRGFCVVLQYHWDWKHVRFMFGRLSDTSHEDWVVVSTFQMMFLCGWLVQLVSDLSSKPGEKLPSLASILGCLAEKNAKSSSVCPFYFQFSITRSFSRFE